MTQPLEIGSRRRCNNDGKLYTVKKGNHFFCSDRCRSEFHRFGSPLIQLRERIGKEVERATDEIEYRLYTALDQPTRIRYRQLWPAQARRLDARQQRTVEEATY